MTKYSLYVHLEAKPGKEQAVADFLAAGLLTNREATRADLVRLPALADDVRRLRRL